MSPCSIQLKRSFKQLGLILAILNTSLACSNLNFHHDGDPISLLGIKYSGNRSLAHEIQDLELIHTDYEPGEIQELCKKAITKADQQLSTITQNTHHSSALLAFETLLADLSDEVTPLTFMGYVSTLPKIREEASECEQKLGQYQVEVFSRRDLYQAIKKSDPQNHDEIRLKEKTLENFENNGLNLADAELNQVKELRQQLTALETQFGANLNNDASSAIFDRDELEGVSENLLNRIKRTPEGKYILTTKVTDYTQLMQTAVKSETRKKMALAYLNRAADKNVALLEQAITLRQKIAKLMGYKNWAEYRIHGRMARDSATVLKFLESLKDKLAQKNKKDIARLLKFKKELDPKANQVHAWDTIYLDYQLKKKNYDLDDEKLREYFPAETVISGLFKVYSKLLSVNFNEVFGAKSWSPDVKLYQITDAKNGRLIGYFYADFFPRAGKYEHAAAFTLATGRQLANGNYSFPISAIVANFNPPSNGKPSLLSHHEVETVFHEFGHIMHQTLTRAPYASLSGSSVAQDFVEAPSQMLENWVWSPESLQLMSGYYLKPDEKLPSELLKKMLDSRDFNQGLFYTRQLFYALLDMTYHTATDPVDTSQILEKLSNEIIGIPPIPGGHFQAGFGHIMGGYDAGYYGYLWSKVYAEDLFTRFESNGVLNPKVGEEYRRVILEKGNMKEGQDLLHEFLGRESNPVAFFRKLNIGKKSLKP